jgi:cytochrome c oxidase subunit IV
MEPGMDKHQPIPLGSYVLIWLALLVLTAVTITAATLHFGAFSVFAAIAIATVKGSLVLYYFMHLKYEDRIFKLMLLLALFTLAVIMLLTFADVALR